MGKCQRSLAWSPEVHPDSSLKPFLMPTFNPLCFPNNGLILSVGKLWLGKLDCWDLTTKHFQSLMGCVALQSGWDGELHFRSCEKIFSQRQAGLRTEVPCMNRTQLLGLRTEVTSVKWARKYFSRKVKISTINYLSIHCRKMLQTNARGKHLAHLEKRLHNNQCIVSGASLTGSHSS